MSYKERREAHTREALYLKVQQVLWGPDQVPRYKLHDEEAALIEQRVVDVVRTERRRVAALLRRIEHVIRQDEAVFRECPLCGVGEPVHFPSCELAALLREAEA